MFPVLRAFIHGGHGASGCLSSGRDSSGGSGVSAEPLQLAFGEMRRSSGGSGVSAEPPQHAFGATLEHFGGKLLPVTGKYVASLQTSLGGNTTVAPTATPTRAEAFLAMGGRICSKGVLNGVRGLVH